MNKKTFSTFNMQQTLVTVSVVLFIVKIFAWYVTNSVAILTDALESIVNVVAGFIGLYSIRLASKPKDLEHPYGHGKVEFLASAIEGILISIAGIIIIFEALNNLRHPHELKSLDKGLILVAITAIINYMMGYLCAQKGKKENSPILIASGAHLKSDTYSTLGLLIGIALLMFTQWKWIDSVVAFIFAIIIIITGYKIIRKSISGIMDESDHGLIDEIVIVLNENRLANWIDVHNMRVINYAGFYHIDCHLTVPYYFTVNEAHVVLDSMTKVLDNHFKQKVEFFIHVDGCLSSQCVLCKMLSCPQRKINFVKQIPFNHENVLANQKHELKLK